MITLFKILFIFLGAAFGSVIRFWIGEAFRLTTQLPGWVAIFCANLVGSLIIGISFAWLTHEALVASSEINLPNVFTLTKVNIQLISALLVTGLCGGLTTFSAFGLDNIILLYENKWLQAIFNIIISIGFCTLAVIAGIYIGGGSI